MTRGKLPCPTDERTGWKTHRLAIRSATICLTQPPELIGLVHAETVINLDLLAIGCRVPGCIEIDTLVVIGRDELERTVIGAIAHADQAPHLIGCAVDAVPLLNLGT